MAPMNASENNLDCSLLSAGSHALNHSQAAKSSRGFLLDFQGLSPDVLCSIIVLTSSGVMTFKRRNVHL